VRVVDLNAWEVGFDEGDVEPCAVETGEDGVFVEFALEVVCCEVLAVDEGGCVVAVVDADGGDAVALFVEACGFDVDVADAILEFAVEPPVLALRHLVFEEGAVTSFKVLLCFVKKLVVL